VQPPAAAESQVVAQRGKVKVAAHSFVIREATSFEQFAVHAGAVLDQAREADLLVLPTLLTFELYPTLEPRSGGPGRCDGARSAQGRLRRALQRGGGGARPVDSRRVTSDAQRWPLAEPVVSVWPRRLGSHSRALRSCCARRSRALARGPRRRPSRCPAGRSGHATC
jgi:hypothetical protein